MTFVLAEAVGIDREALRPTVRRLQMLLNSREFIVVGAGERLLDVKLVHLGILS